MTTDEDYPDFDDFIILDDENSPSPAQPKPKPKSKDVEEQDPVSEFLQDLGLDAHALKDSPRRPQRQTGIFFKEWAPSWRDSTTALATWMRRHYKAPIEHVDTQPAAGKPAVFLDDETMHIDFDGLGGMTPNRLNSTPDENIPVGSLRSPRVQIHGCTLFGLLHLELAPFTYSAWRQDLDISALPERFRRDAEAILPFDDARCWLRAAGSSGWMLATLRAGLLHRLKDPAHRPLTSPDEQIKWLIVNIILPATSGLVGESAAMMARRVTAAAIGPDSLDAIESWWADYLGLINPTASEALFFGHQFTEMWNDVCFPHEVEGFDLAVSTAMDAMERPLRKQLKGLEAMWPRMPHLDKPAKSGLAKADKKDPLRFTEEKTGVPSTEGMSPRMPDETDRSAIDAIARQLQQARIRKPGVSVVPSSTPRGRMNTRQYVQARGQQAAGVPVTATPWSQFKAHQRAVPDITVAIACDISASMGPWRKRIGPLAWQLAQAAHKAGGTVAAWGFSGEVRPLVRPNRLTSHVPVLLGNGGSSYCCAEALEHASRDAGLRTARGARVALVITDGDLPSDNGERDKIQQQVDSLRRDQVTIYWVSTMAMNYPMWTPQGVRPVSMSQVNRFADDVIRIVVQELEAA